MRNEIPDEYNRWEPTLDKRDVQLFLKRLRKANDKMVSYTEKLEIVQQRAPIWPQIRYYAVGEYGTKTDRPHYHLIIFNIKPEVKEQLEQIWGLGQIMAADVTDASIHYVTKYVINRFSNGKNREKPFSLMSRRPALGNNYLLGNKAWHINNNARFCVQGGFRTAIPRYYREKIFTNTVSNAIANYKAIAKYDEKWAKEVHKQEKLGNDENYIFEKIRYLHDHLKNKENEGNTF